MTAINTTFPWMSYYKNYNYFLNILRNHNKVSKIVELNKDKGYFKLYLKDSRELKLFICECYCFSVAEYEEALSNLKEIDAVVINSSWCGYTSDVKDYCKAQKVGIFKISEFLGAINLKNFWNYIPPDER